MPWIIVYVGLAVAGLAVLAVLGRRVLAEARNLSEQLRRASHGIRAASEELDRAVASLAARRSRPDA
ncbi:hypothetical protein GCM10027168_66570 [Streptomyces capparidis]